MALTPTHKRLLRLFFTIAQTDLMRLQYKSIKDMEDQLEELLQKDFKLVEDKIDLINIKEAISDIPKELKAWKNGESWGVIKAKEKITLTTHAFIDDLLIPGLDWQDLARDTFIRSLFYLKKDDLHECDYCGSLFLKAGKKEKRFCSARCGSAQYKLEQGGDAKK